MKKILITGGAGFVASALAEKLIQDPENFVVIADNLLTGSIQKLPSSNYNNWRFIKCDVNDYKDISAIFFSHSFDYVFHYAAVVGVKRTLDNPIMVLRDLQGFENILKLCKNTHVKRVFFSSSSEVYGEPVEFPQKELTTPLNSRLPYAVVKNIGEAFLRSYKQEYDLGFTIFRFFNTYGPKQSQDFVMSKFIYAALHNKDITIYGDGSQTRTFCYIDDNTDACYKAFKNNLCINEVANIGNDIEISIRELAELIIDITGSASKIVHLPPLEDGDMKRRKPDNTIMRSLLGRELTPIRDGITKVIELGNFNR
jgi:nucleoside-diphosphate-sugar epimerase